MIKASCDYQGHLYSRHSLEAIILTSSLYIISTSLVPERSGLQQPSLPGPSENTHLIPFQLLLRILCFHVCLFFSLNFSSEIITCKFAWGVWIACLANHSEFCEGISTPPARKQMVNTLVEARQLYFFFYRGNNELSAVHVRCMIETELIQCTLKPGSSCQADKLNEFWIRWLLFIANIA